jgi:predicted nucleotidyltransferase
MNVDNLKNNREEMEKKGILLVVLFGSQARGAARKDSDYDIAVLTDENRSLSDFDNYSQILFFLSRTLEIPAEKIDLTKIREANPLLQYEIFSKGKLLFGDRNLFDEYHAVAFREYIDAKKLLELESKMVKQRVSMLKKLILQV